MAALSTSFTTLADWAKRQDPKGGIADVIEVLAETNPILQDANVMEGNLVTGHRSTRRTTQPSGTWRQLNQGVAETKSTTTQVDDGCGMLEAYSAVDVALANLNATPAAFRASEDNAFSQGLSEDAVDAIIYGNSGQDPEQPHGLAPRYNSTTGDTGGELPWDDASSNPYQAYVTHFQWYLGLAVPDYRYNIRICNIDVSELTTSGATGADLLEKMVTAFYARPTVALGTMTRTYWYCNKTVAEYLHHQASNKSNVNLTIDNPAGMPVVRFLGAPVRVCDAITSAEATIS